MCWSDGATITLTLSPLQALLLSLGFSFSVIPGCFMEKAKLAEFKKDLTSQMEALIAESLKTMGDMTYVKENMPDPTDLASEDYDRNFLLRIRDRERKLILKIKEAIARIDDGSFGVCEICGDDISEERLRARPVTTQCIECKTEAEVAEKKMRRI